MHTIKRLIITIVIVLVLFSFVSIFETLYVKEISDLEQELEILKYPITISSYVRPSKLYFLEFKIPSNISKINYGKCGGSYNYIYIEPEPNEAAESLEGKELYIFYIKQIHEQYYPDVDPYIAMAIMETESNYNPDVESRAGAVGLMQVIPKYHLWRAEQYGLNDIWDPYTNIICGMDLMNELYYKYGSWEQGLLGYNNSKSYVEYVLYKADALRGGNYFGEEASSNAGSS